MGHDQVVVEVDGGPALDQVEVHVAEAQPGAVAEGRREIGLMVQKLNGFRQDFYSSCLKMINYACGRVNCNTINISCGYSN